MKSNSPDPEKNLINKKKKDIFIKQWGKKREIVVHNYKGKKNHPLFLVRHFKDIKETIKYVEKESRFLCEVFINGDLKMLWQNGECVWENSIV